MKVAVPGAGAIGAHVGAAPHRAGADVHLHRGVGCNLTLHVQDNEIVKVTSPHDNPVTHRGLCIKGRFGYQHVQNRG